jgi:hypothetical protein
LGGEPQRDQGKKEFARRFHNWLFGGFGADWSGKLGESVEVLDNREFSSLKLGNI